ncbi:MAG: DUF2935 domain-containing protein [Bacillota bacterium]
MQTHRVTDRDFVRRSLEENRFWLRIMKEHSLFLSEGFNRRDGDLIRTANRFFEEFDRLLRRARELSPLAGPGAIRRFNQEVIRAVRDLRNFKQEVLLRIITCRIAGFNLPLLVDHIRREAEYFITVLTRLNEGIDEPVEAAIARENVFWLRIMADHSRFIRNLLDPSERRLVEAADQFADQFDQLLAQARDLDSMFQGFSPVLVIVGGHLLDQPTLVRLQEEEERDREERETEEPLLVEETPPVLAQFTEDVIGATQEIRDFKRTAARLLADCRTLSVINPLLADHVAREAEKFLEILGQLEQRLGPVREKALVVTQPAPPCPELEPPCGHKGT